MNSYIETDIIEVKEQLAWNYQHGHKTIVVLGSGVSVSAGIPATEGIIHRIRRDFSSICSRTHPVTYEDHLAVLTTAQRQTLIKELVADAKLNAAHLYFAGMVKAGYVDKIITTNFDTLLHRALALENVYPNIFDFTASQTAESADFSNISLFHMHGQKDGMLHLRDDNAFELYLDKMQRFFGDSFEKQTVIVVGYSGSDDPVFGYLASVRTFENRLYWVGHNQNEPEDHVVRGILQKTKKQACYIKGYDADSFFMGLSDSLGLNAPRIISDPMSLVNELRGHIALVSKLENAHPEPVALNTTDSIVVAEIHEPTAAEVEPEALSVLEKEEPLNEIRVEEIPLIEDLPKPAAVDKAIEENALDEWLAKSITQEEPVLDKKKGVSKTNSQKAEDEELIKLTRETWSNNIYDNYNRLKAQITKSDNEEARKYFSFFLFNWGAELEHQADKADAEKATELYEKAFAKYEEAIGIKPDLREAYNNWGVCLRNLAKTKGGSEGERLYEEAFRKFEEAIIINPEEHEPYNNWAIGLANLAETKSEVEAEKLYLQAFEKYQDALKNKPDLVEVYNNWGVCLKNLAGLKREAEAEVLYNEAFQKFGQAVKLKPDFTTAWINWGITLRYKARMKRSGEAAQLFSEAIEKYSEAIEINPNSAEAMNNWGIDLGNLALLHGLDQASELLEKAFHKYELALQKSPELYEAYNNWGIDLWNLGNMRSGLSAEALYSESFQKFDLALAIQPQSAEVYTNKGICQSKVAVLKDYPKSEKLFRESFMSFKKASEFKPQLFEACYHWGIALRNYARTCEGGKAEDLYIKALKQFEKAMKSVPERYKLYRDWDANIVNLSDTVSEESPEKLYHQTFREYQDAIFIERSSLDLYNNYDLSLTMPNTANVPDLDKVMSENLAFTKA
ncbi:MAG: SIR2 family protein [Bacteroidia bacterium]|nr:SIR2 family protein [Bacteroidia bacterium]